MTVNEALDIISAYCNGKITEVVRCKDCKFSRESYTPHILLWCDKQNKHCTFDWFCADGEHKSTDEILMEEMDADPLG